MENDKGWKQSDLQKSGQLARFAKISRDYPAVAILSFLAKQDGVVISRDIHEELPNAEQPSATFKELKMRD